MSAADISIPSDPLVDCPTCGMPAEITDRFVLDGVPTPVEHVKLVCVRGHWYTPPIDQLLLPETRRSGRDAQPPSSPPSQRATQTGA